MKMTILSFTLFFGAFVFMSFYQFTSSNQEKIIELTEPSSFDKMMSVLTHPRCINCHPSDNVPKQGMDGRPHQFGMERGNDNHGFQATKCNTCHQRENNNYSGVPGAPHWGLAPASMAWEGLNRIEIAKSMLNPEKNGGRSYDDILRHLTEDKLVLWAWNPGVNQAGEPREKPPISEEEFKEAVRDWFENGAIIPES